MSTFSLTGKNIVITGGGSGIGKAISTTFAENGASLHILDLSPEHFEVTINEIVEKKGIAKGYSCNVSNHKEVKALIDSIAKNHQIDILINLSLIHI